MKFPNPLGGPLPKGVPFPFRGGGGPGGHRARGGERAAYLWGRGQRGRKALSSLKFPGAAAWGTMVPKGGRGGRGFVFCPGPGDRLCRDPKSLRLFTSPHRGAGGARSQRGDVNRSPSLGKKFRGIKKNRGIPGAFRGVGKLRPPGPGPRRFFGEGSANKKKKKP